MSLKAQQFALSMTLVIILCCGGCRMGKQPCCVDTPAADSTAILHSSGSTGQILASFDAVEQSAETDHPLPIVDFFARDSASISLHECCCAAAVNAPLADAIDKERTAQCCQGITNRCVDNFLAGQALSQRNKAASIAGELFLRLVEINLQQELLTQAQDRLNELRETSKFAAEQGFATVDADTEIDTQTIELRNKQADLEKAHLDVTAKLNVALGNSLSCPKAIYPDFELLPVYEPVDNDQEILTAFANRAELNSISQNECGCMDSECFSILAQLDPRLGISPLSAIRKCLLLQKICNREDPARGVRNQQFEELKSAREELVRLEVTTAVLNIQSGYKKLTIENDNVQRLETRLAALSAGSELEPLDFFLKTIEAWSERQAAKSARITKAIDFEIAKIKLLEATGQWTEVCGLGTSPSCTCDN